MRKIDVAGVREDFLERLDHLAAFHNKASAALDSDEDQSTLVEGTLLSCAVFWEGFVSDLFVAYVNRDASQFKVHLKNSFEADLKDKRLAIYKQFGRFEFPAHLRKADVAALLDGKGNNLSFVNARDMQDYAETVLAGPHAARFIGLTAAQSATINAWVALRNHIAHRSKRSLDALNDSLRAGPLHGTGLQRGQHAVNHVGAYLKAKPLPAQPRRIALIVQGMRGIANAL